MTAVVTGGNRGMGLEICRQLLGRGYRVILTCRDQIKGEAAVDALGGGNDRLLFVPLDVTNEQSIKRLDVYVADRLREVHVLINNAGAAFDRGGLAELGQHSLLDAPLDDIRCSIEINTLGALRMCQIVVPYMRAQGYGRVVNVSSGMGQLADMGSGWPGYRLSKTAMNGVTRLLAAELGDGDIKVNSVCPGWVRTDMGGSAATRSVAEGVETTLWLATLPDNGPTGGFFRDRQSIDW